MTDYAQILTVKYAGKLWQLDGDDYEGLTWLSETTKPTKSKLDSFWDEVQAEVQAEATAKADARTSALNKLSALGLTQEEIDSL